MTPLFIWLAAIGSADLINQVAVVEPRRRSLLSSSIAGVVAAAASLGSNYDWGWHADLLVGVAVMGATYAWLMAQAAVDGREGEEKARAAIVALWGYGCTTALVVMTSGLWPGRSAGRLHRWINELPYGSDDLSAVRALSLAAAVVFLLESANVIVRLVLAAISVESGTPKSPETSIKGGRIIGPIERLLIFGLAVAGEPTAAGLIISAKGLLRYPELSAAQRPIDREPEGGERSESPDPGQLSEYLVVGSMVSWSLALVLLIGLPSI